MNVMTGWKLPQFVAIVLISLLLMSACSRGPKASEPSLAGSEWREFQGTWTAAGNRQSMRLGRDRLASIASFNGSLMLTGPSRPSVGFRAEAIVLNDSVTGLVGRAIWTDERGNQLYSELKGEGTAAGNKIAGTFLGGSGRYAGAEGTYEFSWRFVLQNEDGSVAGESLDLKGRVRVGMPQAAPQQGGPPS